MAQGTVQGALWEMEPPVERGGDEPALVVDVEGFEGPLDLLLTLARNQKVDLTRISILALAEQYLAYVAEARRLRLDLAADYLVMAAWLAYLKSRLLLPEPEAGEEPSAGEMAAALAFRLRRLEAMREAAAKLVNRNRLGRDVFARGMPEEGAVVRRSEYGATLYDLLAAYAGQRQRQAASVVRFAPRPVMSLKEARAILFRLVGDLADWAPLDALLAPFVSARAGRAGVLASSFGASLEMVREGRVELRQAGAFQPLFIRRRGQAPAQVSQESSHG